MVAAAVRVAVRQVRTGRAVLREMVGMALVGMAVVSAAVVTEKAARVVDYGELAMLAVVAWEKVLKVAAQ